MKLFFKTFFCVAFFLSPALVCGQNSETYLQNADKYFEQGDYERAVKNYIVVQDLHGQDVTAKLKAAEQCLEHLKLGNEAYFKQNYELAKAYFERILEINPIDPNMTGKIQDCKREIAKTVQSTAVNNDVIVRESRFISKGHNNYLAWGVLDAGYPWMLGTSFVGRHGRTMGIGYYFSVGIDFGGKATYANTLDDSYYRFDGNYNKSINTLSYSVGIKLFPYNNFFLSLGYGTLGCYKMSVSNSDDGRWNTEGWRQSKGIPILIGCDVITGNLNEGSKTFLSFGAGLSYDTFTKELKPIVNVKIGVTWGLNN